MKRGWVEQNKGQMKMAIGIEQNKGQMKVGFMVEQNKGQMKRVGGRTK